MSQRRRRGRGEGAIYQRKEDGLWCAYVTVGYDDKAKRKRRVVYGSTKKDVQTKLAELHSKSVTGMLTDPQRLTMRDFMNSWLKDTSKPSVRESTYLRYESIIRKHITPYIGGLQLAKLQPSHVQGLYTRLEEEGAQPRTRELAHVLLRKALKQAVQWGYVPRNVTDAVKKPRVPKKPMKYWNRAQVGTFFETAKSDRLYALYVLAVATGLRQGELLGLRWEDIDLKASTLSVQRQVQDLNGKMVVSEPKTSRGKRRIELPTFAVKALREHRTRMLTEGHHQAWVFPSTNGEPVRRGSLSRNSWKKLLASTDLPPIRFHDLRHTAATLLFAEDVHPKVVQERLGHSTISITLDTYSHVLPSMQKDAAQKLDRVLRSKADVQS